MTSENYHIFEGALFRLKKRVFELKNSKILFICPAGDWENIQRFCITWSEGVPSVIIQNLVNFWVLLLIFSLL